MAQYIVKKDPGRARQYSLATAGAKFTEPEAHNKADLCRLLLPSRLIYHKSLTKRITELHQFGHAGKLQGTSKVFFPGSVNMM